MGWSMTAPQLGAAYALDLLMGDPEWFPHPVRWFGFLTRQRLARIVGRDTAHLDGAEISRAVIETLAESACDGIVAPLFWLAAGGVPCAMAYKAANTLDSMIGHPEPPYRYFGRVAARLDDAVNWIPARVTALGIVLNARQARKI